MTDSGMTPFRFVVPLAPDVLKVVQTAKDNFEGYEEICRPRFKSAWDYFSFQLYYIILEYFGLSLLPCPEDEVIKGWEKVTWDYTSFLIRKKIEQLINI
jgi:hypothetical protein